MPKSPEGHHPDQTGKAATLPVAGSQRPGKGGHKGADKAKGKQKNKGAKPAAKNGAATGRPGPATVQPNTRVNLALPFSKIEVQEPSNELVELASLLSDLLGALAEWVPEETLAELRTRAQSLCARLGT